MMMMMMMMSSYSYDMTSFDDLCHQVDKSMFSKVLYNSEHILHIYFLPQGQIFGGNSPTITRYRVRVGVWKGCPPFQQSVVNSPAGSGVNTFWRILKATERSVL